MHEKAISSFKRAARIIPAEIIVDTYLLPDDAKHKRKVERYSRKPLQDYLEERARRREKMIFDGINIFENITFTLQCKVISSPL